MGLRHDADASVHDLPALQIGEIVLRTGRYDAMKHWYREVLRVEPYYERTGADGTTPSQAGEQAWATQVRLCFFRLVLVHPYQQVVALFDVPGVDDSHAQSAGLHHMQFRDPAPAVLARRFLALRAAGIVPFRAMDHGPTTSLYYRDPDRNVVELAAPNHARVEDLLHSLDADEFRINPSGKPLDVERFIEQSAVVASAGARLEAVHGAGISDHNPPRKRRDISLPRKRRSSVC